MLSSMRFRPSVAWTSFGLEVAGDEIGRCGVEVTDEVVVSQRPLCVPYWLDVVAAFIGGTQGFA